MNPKFWIIIEMSTGDSFVEEFETKESLNDFLVTFPEADKIRSLEVISGFSITKRSRSDGK